MAITKLDKASEIAIRDCMGAKKKEKILVVTDENTGRAVKHFTIVGYLDFHIGRGGAHCIGANFAIRLS